MMRRSNVSRRALGIAAGLALAAAGLTVPLAPASSAATCDPGTSTRGDLDGDGIADGVVGMPWYSESTGAVDLQYSGSPARRLAPEDVGGLGGESTEFGSALAVGDLDGDGCADLVIGSRQERGAEGSPGAVHIVFGGPGGIVDDSAFTLEALPGQGFADFGAALALEKPLNATDGRHDLFVGAPGSTVNGRRAAGSVEQFLIQPGGLPGTTDRVTVTAVILVSQNSPGIPGGPEAGDRFGEVLTAGRYTRGVVVAAPGEDLGKAVNAGAIWFVPVGDDGAPRRATSLSQDSAGVGGRAETGDHFGAALSMRGAYLTVGVPDENAGARKDSGLIHTFRQGTTGAFRQLKVLDQDSAGVPGAAEAGDRFGAAVAVAAAPDCPETIGVAAGAPGEDVGPRADAGTVTLLNVAGGCPARVLRQGSGLGGAAEAGDQLGGVIGVVRGRTDLDEDYRDTVLYGVPRESVGAFPRAGLVQSRSPLYVDGRRVGSYTFSAGLPSSYLFGQVLASSSD